MGFFGSLFNPAKPVSDTIDAPETAARTTMAMKEKASGMEVDPRAPINFVRNFVAGAIHMAMLPVKWVSNTALAAMRLIEMPPIALGQGFREVSKKFSAVQRGVIGPFDDLSKAIAA